MRKEDLLCLETNSRPKRYYSSVISVIKLENSQLLILGKVKIADIKNGMGSISMGILLFVIVLRIDS